MEEKLKPYIEKFKQLSVLKQVLIIVLAIFILGNIISSFFSEKSGNITPKEVATQSVTPAQPVAEKMSDKEQLKNLSPSSEIVVKYALSCRSRQGDVIRLVAMDEAASMTMYYQNPSEYKEWILALTNTSDAEYNFQFIPFTNREYQFGGTANLNRQTLWLYTIDNNPRDTSGTGYQCTPIGDKEGALENLKKDRQAYRDYVEMKKNNDEIEKQNTKAKLIQNQKI